MPPSQPQRPQPAAPAQPPARQPTPQAAPPAPAAPPTTRALLVALLRTLDAAGCPRHELVHVTAWARWVTCVAGCPDEDVDARALGAYDAAREALAEVSSRVVRAHAGVPNIQRSCAIDGVRGWNGRPASGRCT